MKTKIALTSMLALFVAAPAFADPVAAEWPEDKYMQENKVYANAATDTNMDGVSDGTVNANAEYTDDEYTIPAGKYLAAATEGNSASDFTDCTAGNFCPGASNVLYSATDAQGLTSCATVGDGTYVNSAVGSSVNTECYKACTVAVANIAHATAVIGNDYYGAGTDTCGATRCEPGYHVNRGVDLAALIGSAAGTASGYRVNGTYTGDATVSGVMEGDFIVQYADNKSLFGSSVCSNQAGTTRGNTALAVNDTEGASCWCRLKRLKTGSGMSISNTISTTTLAFNQTFADTATCQSSCLASCATLLKETSDLSVRNALFAAVPTYSTCEANVVRIDWTDAEQTDIDTNRAGYTVYDSEVRTPVKAVDKPGKTFRGWKFEAPEDNDGSTIQDSDLDGGM